MGKPLKLVTSRESAAAKVVEFLESGLVTAREYNCCGMALALVRQDGGVTVTSFGKGTRVLLLGAVTDLQYTLAKDGDAD